MPITLISGSFFTPINDVADELIGELEKQNEVYKKTIYDLEQKKLKNKIAEEVFNIKYVHFRLVITPEKVMRYESLSRSWIFQNLAIFKKAPNPCRIIAGMG